MIQLQKAINHLLKEIIVVHLLRKLLLHLFILRLPNGPLGLDAPLSYLSLWVGRLKNKKANHEASRGQNAQALFAHHREGADLNMKPNQPLTDDRDANGNDTNVFASERKIKVSDAYDGPALRTPPMQEIQYFIMWLMELLTGRNKFAIDFWANLIAQAQVRDYKARTLHAPEVTRHAEVSPHKVLANAANSQVDGYIQNLQLQIIMLYKQTMLSIQHILEGNAKETLIDLVSVCAALLHFAERPILIQIKMKEDPQVAQQFDPGFNRVVEVRTQLSLCRPQLRNRDVTRAIDSIAGDVYTNSDRIIILLLTADTKNLDIKTIPGIWHVPKNTTISRFSVTRTFLVDPTFFRLQYITHHAYWVTLLFNLAFRARILNKQTNNTANNLRSDYEHQYKSNRTRNSLNKLDCIKFTTFIDQGNLIKNISKPFQSSIFPRTNNKHELAIISCSQRLLDIKELYVKIYRLKGQWRTSQRFGQCLLNVSVFIQRHTTHEYLTTNDWKAFQIETDTDLYLNKMTKSEMTGKIIQIQEDEGKERD
ncbi:MAG: hypothetical protein EZS28_018953 [Streblomastix strix]|uniref:Uncharacterized protein n=1 Tax=Streblomastix strix TaxID=222440 RepID=A0A5J4VSY1_9EUKA|nr:MAG: hypothetical protein EZS28_018953 [Streblomastix strix]